jgi:DNA-binding winged helix-turn-helix (wHTH) protein
MDNTGSILRFGEFEVDLRSGELRKSGDKIKLQDQPFKVLAILLVRSGQLVTREELRRSIWPEENFGDFDHAVNVAVAKLRVALGDSSDNPRYIETLPRRGYRFAGTAEIVEELADQSPNGRQSAPQDEEKLHQPAPNPVSATTVRQFFLKRLWQPRWYGPLVLVMCVLGVLFLWRRAFHSYEPEFRRISFGRGYVHTARFTPDGENVVYGATWEGKPLQIFWNRVDGTDSRPLSALDLDILSISSKGQMAVLLGRKFTAGLSSEGTLALMQLTGSAPRPVLDHVQDADWSPDGTKLAVTHNLGDRWQLEFPVGTVIYQVTGPWMSHARVSPKGNLIAFLEHPLPGDDAGYVVVVDLAGNRRRLTGDFPSVEGLAWDRSGEEIWFGGDDVSSVGGGRSLFKVSLAGKQTLVRHETSHLTVHDVSRNGILLVTRDAYRSSTFGRIYPDEQERDISWLDYSVASHLSKDGATLVLSVQGEAAGRGYEIYVRSTKPGAAALRLGEGYPCSLSPDGKWVLSDFPGGLQASAPPQLVMLPTGTGEPVKVTSDNIAHSCGTWLADGRLLFTGNQPEHKMRTWVQDRTAGSAHPITPEGTTGLQVSPNNLLVAIDEHEAYWLYPIAGGAATPLKGFQPGDDPIVWSADGGSVFVARYGIVGEVYRINIANGNRQFIRRITPRDTAGSAIVAVLTTPDGKSYVYSHLQILSDVYTVGGLN